MLGLAGNIDFIYVGAMTVGERLQAARKRLRKTQSDIADELNCTQPTVHSWESDENLPRTKEIRAVAEAYGLRPELLLPEAAS